MQLVIYFFLSLIYFKAFPVFLIGVANPIFGALMMSISSTFVVFFTVMAVNLKALQWFKDRATGLERVSFFERVLLQMFIGLSAAAALGYFVAVGFSPRLIGELTGYRGDGIIWLFVLILIPPLAHLLIAVASIERAERQMHADRNTK